MHRWIYCCVAFVTVAAAGARADVGGPIAPTASHPWIAGLALSMAAAFGGIWLSRRSAGIGWCGAYVLLWAAFLLAGGLDLSNLLFLILALWTLGFIVVVMFRLLARLRHVRGARQQDTAPEPTEASAGKPMTLDAPGTRAQTDGKDAQSAQPLAGRALPHAAGLGVVYFALVTLLFMEVLAPGVFWKPNPRFIIPFSPPTGSGGPEPATKAVNTPSE